MKPVLISAILFALGLSASAHSGVDSLFLDVRTNFHQQTENGVYDSQIRGDHFNVHIHGHIADNLNYRVRHSLRKPVYDPQNMFNATDLLYLNWRASERWSFLVGKYAVLIGGYEYDAAPIDVYFYSKFCNSIDQGFTFGGSSTYHFNASQAVVAQVCNSPLARGKAGIYAYNFAWTGQMAPFWHTIWSVNFVEDPGRNFINYISLGNHLVFGDVMIDFDAMNRASFAQDRFLFSDMTLISKFIWSVGDWNICAKAGYEWNDTSNVRGDGTAYDTVIAPGTEYIYGGCGVEWFPLGRKNLRLHAVYYRDSALHRNSVEFGLTWRMNIIKK